MRGARLAADGRVFFRLFQKPNIKKNGAAADDKHQNADGGSGAGKAYLILGASLGTTSEIDLSLADYSFVGEEASDGAGISVSSAGDVDGDGLDDLLVGAHGNDDGGSAAGKTYLILSGL